MWWDTKKYDNIWQNFSNQSIDHITRIYYGDQDYITEAIPDYDRRFFEVERVKSWRWECFDGGYDFKRRIYFNPNTGTRIQENTSVLVFHGKPKPSDIKDAVILQHWQ
jgi:hypothetical protein